MAGSNWAAELVAAAGWTTFFQFGGVCDGLPILHLPADVDRLTRGLMDAWTRGCRCGWPLKVQACNAQTQAECVRRVPFCDVEAIAFGGILKNDTRALEAQRAEIRDHRERLHGYGISECNQSCRPGGGVAVVAPPIPRHGGKDAVRRALASTPDARLVGWVRSNSVKHGLSGIKAHCQCAGISNHASAEDAERADQQPCFVHTPAATLYKAAAERAKSLLDYVEGADLWGSGLPVSHVIYYEEAQQDSVCPTATARFVPDTPPYGYTYNTGI